MLPQCHILLANPELYFTHFVAMWGSDHGGADDASEDEEKSCGSHKSDSGEGSENTESEDEGEDDPVVEALPSWYNFIHK